VNLANIDNVGGDPVRALELAGTAERLMRDEHDLAREPAHFRVMYTQATAYLQQAGDAKSSTEDATRASQHAVDTLVRLVTSCAAILATDATDSGSPFSIGAKTRDDALEDLERTVQLFLPAAASALASAQAARDPADVEVAPVEDVTDESRREAIATLREVTFTTSSNTIVRALGKLFDDNQLPNAAHYNLACMYSWALPAAGTPVSPAQAAGAKGVGTRALRHLRMACELPVTDERAEARKDPDLERLRAWSPTEFERITKAVEPQPAPPSRIARPGYWASRPR
jgi:TPR repeat protein